MARSKKPYIDLDSMPSLFDAGDIGLNDPADDITLPGLDRHVRSARKAYDARSAAAPREPLHSPLGDLPTPRKVTFISFGSGSSGNCAYIGTDEGGLLIDAGVEADNVEKELSRNGISPDSIEGIILTHDHGDHVRYAYNLLRRHRRMLLYCTPRVMSGILRRHNISRRIKDFHKAIYKETPFRLAGFEITAFDVDHDGSDNSGFYISRPGFAFTVATDMGHITDRADYYMRLSDHLMIEANYDLDMLRRGTYPEYLKARIMGPSGHLDNTVTAAYLAGIYTPRLKNIFLCHLSNDNNTPPTALRAVADALAAIGVATGDCSNSPSALQAPVQLMALPRFDSTGAITFRLPAAEK